MPDPPSRLTRADARDFFRVALDGDAESDSGWSPPSPQALAPFFPGYEIEALLGRGGMGAVYRARQRSLGRTVALKLLPFALGVREDFAERFRREATALARLNHPHIVAVHDFGQADDGHFFMVMEFVEGTDLAARLHAHGPLATDAALAIVRQVCDALEYAHAHGVVHRDIKPANILLDPEDGVKVSDFGIAQFTANETTPSLTGSGALLGTPDYAAPEQSAQSAVADHRADIFSVGVVLYEILTGHLPRGVFRPVSAIVPAARGLDRVITRALQSEPGLRYLSVAEMRGELIGLKRAARCRIVRFLTIAGVLVFAAALAFPIAKWRRKKTAAPALPFENSLGLRFVPAGTPGVLFATWHTRVRDFAAFTKAGVLWAGDQIFVNYDGSIESWQQVNLSWADPGFPQTPEHPVVGVSQMDATAFCAWITEYERKSGRIGAMDFYRLPTDGEWSVAAGLSTDTHDPAGVYPWRGTFPPPPGVGNYAGAELREDARFARFAVIAGYRDPHRFTAPVGSFPPNARGLHELGSNVTEWLHSDDPQRAQMRGGNWWDAAASSLDAGKRRSHDRTMRAFTSGFRIVLVRK